MPPRSSRSSHSTEIGKSAGDAGTRERPDTDAATEKLESAARVKVDPRDVARNLKGEQLREDARVLQAACRVLNKRGYHANANACAQIASKLNGDAHAWTQTARA